MTGAPLRRRLLEDIEAQGSAARRPDSLMAGTCDDNLHRFRSVGHIAIVSAETQQCVLVPVDVVGACGVELAALATQEAAWFGPETVRDDLRLLLEQSADAGRPPIELALDEADYACRYGTGIAIVPPPAT